MTLGSHLRQVVEEADEEACDSCDAAPAANTGAAAKKAHLKEQAIAEVLALVDGDGEDEIDRTAECFGGLSLTQKKPLYRGDEPPLVSRALSDASWDSLDTASLDSDILAACVSSGEWDGRAADGSALGYEIGSMYEEVEKANEEERQATQEVMDMVTVAPNVVLAKKSDASRGLPRATTIARTAHATTQTAVATGGEGETRAMHIVRRRPQRLVTQTDLARELLRVNDSDIMIRLCRKLRRDQSTRRLCEAVCASFGPELLAEAVRGLKGTVKERQTRRAAKLGAQAVAAPPSPTVALAVTVPAQPPAAALEAPPTPAVPSEEQPPLSCLSEARLEEGMQSLLELDGDWSWML